MKDNVIVVLKFGAHLYGTQTENSDTDYKSVFIPDLRDVLLGKFVNTKNNDTKRDSSAKNSSADIDDGLMSLHHFINKACSGEMVTMDMLHAPKSMAEKWSPVWQEIVDNRYRFYTKKMSGLSGYCYRQAAKYGIKGSRLNDEKRAINYLKKWAGLSIRLGSGNVWRDLPEGRHISIDNTFYTVCGKKLQKTIKVELALDILEKDYRTHGHRTVLAAKNEGIDWKALSHAFRAAGQMKELFLGRTITFPRPEADYLVAIKTGQLDFLNEVKPALENLMDEVSALAEKSDLPEEADRVFWDNFIVRTMIGETWTPGLKL